MYVWDIDPDFPKEERGDQWEKVKRNKTITFESRHRTKDGETFPVEINSQYVSFEDREYEFAFARDITEHKQVEEKLRSSEERFRKFFQSGPDPTYLVSKEGVIENVNEALCEKSGYDREDLIGTHLEDADLFPNESQEKILKNLERRMAGEDVPPYTVEVRRRDGETLLVEIDSGLLRTDGEIEGVLGVARDVTEERELQEELKTERAMLQNLLANLPISVYFKDEEGRLMQVSDYYIQQPGAPPVDSTEDIIGKTDFDLYSEELAEKARKDDERVMESREPVIDRGERSVSREGGEIYLQTTKAPMIDEEGNVMGIVGFTRDITRRKQAERWSEFLHSLLRHDLRNKAQIVQGYHEMLLNLNLPDEWREFLKKAMKANQEGIELIEKVRALRKVGRESVGKINVNRIIEDVVEENRTQASEKGMEIDCGGGECMARGGTLLKELVSNLVKNSIKHSGGDRVQISVQKSDDKCTITVEDDGRGIPEEDKDRVFEREFKRGKNAGSGLGLNLVRRVAKHYNGEVNVKDSELGGARFDVTLERA